MELQESIGVAVANMKATKVRSVLSMLGLVIGTASIIIVVAIANGSRKAIIESMSAGNVDVLYIWPWYNEASHRVGTLSLTDVDKLAKLRDVESAVPEILVNREVRGRGTRQQMRGLGVDPGYLESYLYKMVVGRDVNSPDIKERALICIFTRDAAKLLFQGRNPVGNSVRIGGVSFEVVGVVDKPKGGRTSFGMAKHADYFVPLSTLLYLEKELMIPSIRLRIAKGRTEIALPNIRHFFDLDPNRKGLFKVSDPKEYIEDLRKKDRALMLQLMSIAAVSLLVGGIGIMNVMLTSVAERTREIGLRKALGATSGNILEQFLVETSFMSGMGGVLGTALGLVVSWALPIASGGRIPTAPVTSSIVASIGFSFAFGLFFGLFPASKAAQLSPIEALRYE